MIVLNIVLGAFILLEISNVLALYFNPTMKQANAVGVFKAWEESKKHSETHDLIQYLTYWVAGTKLIFLCLLILILFFASPALKILAVIALVLSIASFYWKMYPLIKKMDKSGAIMPQGYSGRLGIMIGTFIFALTFAAVIAYLSLTL